MRNRMDKVHELIELRTKIRRLGEEIAIEESFRVVRVILDELADLAVKEKALTDELVAIYVDEINKEEL